MKVRTFGALLALVCAGCGAPPPAEGPGPSASTVHAPVAAPTADPYQTLPPELREPPPAEAPTPAWSFPAIVEGKLPNQLGLVVVERHTLPLVQIKLMIRSGQATDRDKHGLAVLSGEMLKVGGSGQYTSRQLLNRIESLGTSLSIVTSRDSTSLSMSVTTDRFQEAMSLLGLVIQKPRFDTKEFSKLRRREADRVSSSAKSDPAWAGSMVMYRQLYGKTDPSHPYASFDGTADEIEKRALWEAKQWVATHVTPENAFLLVAGDVTLDTVKVAAEKALGGWRGKAPKPPVFSTPTAPAELQIVLVDRPKSSQADVRLATFGPERKAEDWAAVRVANQVLGGGAAGRLFLDVREKQSLAYSAYSSVEEVANGPCPLVLRAGTQTAKVGLTLKALLDHAALLASTPPSAEEVKLASQFLSDVFLVNVESVGDVANLTARLGLLGLPNDYYDRYRAAVRQTDVARAHGAFARYVKPNAGLVVVAGDAARLAAPLSHFGDVEIVDPDQDFKATRTVPKDPSAPIELERLDGT